MAVIGQGMLVFLLYWSLLLLCCGTTIWLGGIAGRVAVATILASSLANLFAWMIDHRIVALWTFPAACDLLQLVCFAALMFRSNRWWPIWLTGFQFDAVLSHTSALLDPTYAAHIFRGLHTFWGTPILVVMTTGALLDHRVRLREKAALPRTLRQAARRKSGTDH